MTSTLQEKTSESFEWFDEFLNEETAERSSVIYDSLRREDELLTSNTILDNLYHALQKTGVRIGTSNGKEELVRTRDNPEGAPDEAYIVQRTTLVQTSVGVIMISNGEIRGETRLTSLERTLIVMHIPRSENYFGALEKPSATIILLGRGHEYVDVINKHGTLYHNGEQIEERSWEGTRCPGYGGTALYTREQEKIILEKIVKQLLLPLSVLD